MKLDKKYPKARWIITLTCSGRPNDQSYVGDVTVVKAINEDGIAVCHTASRYGFSDNLTSHIVNFNEYEFSRLSVEHLFELRSKASPRLRTLITEILSAGITTNDDLDKAENES